MKIKIENSTQLRELRLKRNIEVELPENSTVEDLLLELGLNDLMNEDETLSKYMVMLKNKKTVRSTDTELKDGDTIRLLPMASGG
ncbi:hypothetical protein AKJ40_01995 [candidate division MSBL1 archaeon SCGC-AAA259M10]|uniref:Thiamine biosynthesis protein ThiS n=1 Tax=candidate division MSBL1 archaeon SCGC-AAA259M10 TaxID=1698270 RepID=A0A133V0V9_9EURY|nr:hypothetical protein AKJ40_01995 [candidate division MSBL1 archaeon SCGC-AAA259M10]